MIMMGIKRRSQNAGPIWQILSLMNKMQWYLRNYWKPLENIKEGLQTEEFSGKNVHLLSNERITTIIGFQEECSQDIDKNRMKALILLKITEEMS